MTERKNHSNEQVMGASEPFIDKYKKQLIYGIAAVAIIVACFFLYQSFVLKPKEAKAEELLFKGQDYFAQDNYESALNGDGQGYPGFIKIASEYSNTPSGNLAQLYAGLSYAQMGKPQEAVNYLEKYSSCDDAMVSPAALGALGNCYADLKQLDKATDNLLKAAELADNNTLSPVFLIQAGEIFESQGNKAKALECYKQIKTKYTGSMQYASIDKYIERVSE